MLAVSFTCVRDKESVLRLNKELFKFKVRHLMVVEENEVDEFGHGCISRGLNDNATNGFGGDGSRAKLKMYKAALEYLNEGETLLDLDSDVSIRSKHLIKSLECDSNTMKGFCDMGGVPLYKIADREFYYFTGCCKSYSYDLIKNVCESDKIEYYIDLIARNKFTPSEDCFFSYLCQAEFNCGIENLQGKYTHGKQTKNYKTKKFDIIS